MSGEPLNGRAFFLKRGKQALLFLHGFTSTPHSLLPVAEILAKTGFTVSLPLLPGHGTTPEDMAAHTAHDWLDKALQAYAELAAEYPHPAVAGLSMGAALALHVAANRPVPAVVALAPALYLKDWRVYLIPALKLIMPWRCAVGNDIKSGEFREEAYPRYKVKCIQDLLKVMKTARRQLPQITAPLLAIQSQYDHTIPPTCMDDLVCWIGSQIKEKHRLYNSYHVITMDNEYQKVAELMGAFLEKHIRD